MRVPATSSRARRRISAARLLLASVLTACGGEVDRGAPAEAPDASVDTPAADTPSVTVPRPGGSPGVGPTTHADPTDTASWTVGTIAVPARLDAPPMPVLTDLRTGAHEDFTRVTFEIGPEAPGAPGYRVEYVDRPLIECGSGRQIFPVGDAWLEVRLEPAAAHTEQGEATLGAREVVLTGPQLLRIYRTCDFEGIVTHVLALASPEPFRAFTLAAPWRVVVDVAR